MHPLLKIARSGSRPVNSQAKHGLTNYAKKKKKHVHQARNHNTPSSSTVVCPACSRKLRPTSVEAHKKICTGKFQRDKLRPPRPIKGVCWDYLK